MANYPLPKFHFQVEWGGSTVGFSEVSGLDMQTKPIEYREGSNPVFSKTKMPGMKEYANITMKRGTFGGNIEFYNWFATINLNQVERRNLTISLLDESHSPVMSWSVQNAFPVKVQPSDMKADGNEVAIESIEIAHEGLTILS